MDVLGFVWYILFWLIHLRESNKACSASKYDINKQNTRISASLFVTALNKQKI